MYTFQEINTQIRVVVTLNATHVHFKKSYFMKDFVLLQAGQYFITSTLRSKERRCAVRQSRNATANAENLTFHDLSSHSIGSELLLLLAFSESKFERKHLCKGAVIFASCQLR